MDSHSESLYVIGPISSTSKVGQIELNLVPALIKSHRHGTDKGLDPGSRLIIGSPKPPPNILIIENLHFEGKIFLELSESRVTFFMIMTRKGSLIPRVSA